MHVCEVVRVLVGPGRATVLEEGQVIFQFHQPDATLPTTRLPASATVDPNSHFAQKHVGPL